jgi:hypothetical protein
MLYSPTSSVLDVKRKLPSCMRLRSFTLGPASISYMPWYCLQECWLVLFQRPIMARIALFT